MAPCRPGRRGALCRDLHQADLTPAGRGIVHVFRLQDKRRSRRSRHRGSLFEALAFTPDSKQIVACLMDTSIVTWNVHATHRQHSFGKPSLASKPIDSYIVSILRLDIKQQFSIDRVHSLMKRSISPMLAVTVMVRARNGRHEHEGKNMRKILLVVAVLGCGWLLPSVTWAEDSVSETR